MKQPRTPEAEDANAQNPSWQLNHLEVADSLGGWHTIQRDKLLDIRSKLANFESMTWNQILVESKKQNHTVSRHRLTPLAQTRLEKLRLDDVDELISLHLSGKERVFGIRDRSILRLLWWDPNHEICPSKMKHT